MIDAYCSDLIKVLRAQNKRSELARNKGMEVSEFWRYLSPGKNEITKIKVNGKVITDPEQIAIQFNAYFYTTFSKKDMYEFLDCCAGRFEGPLVTREGVVALLLKLNVKKSMGLDAIASAFLRRYAEQIAQFLTHLLNLSIGTDYIPDDWRMARVVPVFKKEDKLDYSNYRPVSNTSTCCKMLEHVVANYIESFLLERNLLSHCQHGFRRGMSTTIQLVLTVHEVSEILDQSGQVDMLFLDVCKAFDKGPHGKLLYKLTHIGLPLSIVRWVNSFLKNRKQFVEINNCASGMLD